MKNQRKWAVIGSVLLMTVLSIITAYLLLIHYYSDRFLPGTYVNGINCTGKTIPEADRLLSGQNPEYVFQVVLKDGSAQELILSEHVYRSDYTALLENILDQQKKQKWMLGLFIPSHREPVLPVISYEKDKLAELIASLPCMSSGMHETYLYIERTENGYWLRDSSEDYFDPDLAQSVILEAVLSGRQSVDLREAGCYEDRTPVTPQMEEVYREWNAIEAFQNLEITYLFGEEKVTIEKKNLADFLIPDENGVQVCMTDENGNFMIDEEKVRAYVDKLADEYDTYDVSRTFHTINGEDVVIPGGIYGNQLDRKTETEWLSETLQNRQSAERTPVYSKMALYQGADDIGPDYIEVDLTAQKLYFIQAHEVILETDIVSGNLGWRLGTPSRICCVQGKYRNRILRGPGYESFVNYWVPVYKNIGIHDATWRNRFGEEIYKTNGSHGCVNVPYEVMTQLFDCIEDGMPVIMYYTEEVDQSRINNR